MVVCTCRYCLCFFNGAVLANVIMLTMTIVAYLTFGSMPPSFSMTIGFWLLIWTNCMGIYISLLTESIFYRDQDIRWINLLTYYGLALCALCYLIAAILFVIPISESGMMNFSKLYWKLYKEIPPFIDHLQTKFTCCGIHNYSDYGLSDFYDRSYGEEGFKRHRVADLDDDFLQELIGGIAHNETFTRGTTGFNVPWSCCKTHQALDPAQIQCGKKIEYTNSKNPQLIIKQQNEAVERINDPEMGCFEKYKEIMAGVFHKKGALELPFFIWIIRLGSVAQCLLFLVLLWTHRMALKSIRQVNNWLPDLMELHDDAELANAHAALEAEADEVETKAEISGKQKKRESDMKSRKSFVKSLKPSETSLGETV